MEEVRKKPGSYFYLNLKKQVSGAYGSKYGDLVDTRNGKITAAKKVNLQDVHNESVHGHTRKKETLVTFIDMLKEKSRFNN